MSTKPKPTTGRPKLATLAPRVAMADLSITKTTIGSTKESWRASKQSSTQRGYNYKWQQARAKFLQANPLCHMCESAGRVVAATVVDHREPHRGDQELFWRRSNWAAMCSSCHSGEKQRQERRDAA